MELSNKNSDLESLELIDELKNAIENTKSLIVQVEQELDTISNSQCLTDSKPTANAEESNQNTSTASLAKDLETDH